MLSDLSLFYKQNILVYNLIIIIGVLTARISIYNLTVIIFWEKYIYIFFVTPTKTSANDMTRPPVKMA